MKNYLNFETDIKNLELEIEKLKDPYNQDGLSEVVCQKVFIFIKIEFFFFSFKMIRVY